MGPEVQPKCFRHAQHMRNNWELRKRGYLIRFGHTEALLLKKKDIKRPFFPPCRNWPIWVVVQGPLLGLFLSFDDCHKCSQPDLPGSQVFDLTTMTWTETGSLPEGMNGNALVAINRDLGQARFGWRSSQTWGWRSDKRLLTISPCRRCTSAIAGRIQLEVTWSTTLECSGNHLQQKIKQQSDYIVMIKSRFTPEGVWEKVYELQYPRSHFVAIPLPLHCGRK